MKIENDSLFTKSKDLRKLVDLKRGENIVLLPPRVWSAFLCWYDEHPDNIIRRYVIEYPNTPENTEN